MKGPNNEKNIIQEETKSDKFHSDITVVTDSSDGQHEKKILTSTCKSSQSQSTEESESLLKIKKKRYSDMSELVPRNEKHSFKKLKKVTVDFGAQDIFKQPSSEEFVNSTPKKMKKKKYKDSNSNDSDVSDISISSTQKIKKEKDLNTTLNGHDTTPSTKDRKKKNRGLNSSVISQNGETSVKYENSFKNIQSPVKKYSTMSCESTSEHDEPPVKKKKKSSTHQDLFEQISLEDFIKSTLKEKKKKNNGLGVNGINVCDITFPKELLKDKKRKSSVEFGTQDIFKQQSTEDFMNSTPKKIKKKKKNKELDIYCSGVSDITSPTEMVKEEKNEKKDDSVEFGIQDIFKQQSSEDMMSSTPKKVKKKKNKELDVYCSGVHDITSPTEKVKEDENEMKKNSIEFGIQDNFKHQSTKDMMSSTPKKLKKKKNNELDIYCNSVNDITSPIEKFKEDENEMLENSIEFGIQDIFKQQSTEDMMSSTPKKVKKKKNKELDITSPIEKVKENEMKDNSIEFGIQDNFKQQSTEDFMNSSKKIKKKKNKELDITSPIEKVKEEKGKKKESSIEFGTRESSTEYFVDSLTKKAKKKNKKINLSSSEIGDNTMSPVKKDLKYEGSFDNSSETLLGLHTSFDISNDSQSSFEPEESEINLSLTKQKKKKRKHKNLKRDETATSDEDRLGQNGNKKFINGKIFNNDIVAAPRTEDHYFKSSDDSDDDSIVSIDNREILKSNLKALAIEVDFPVPKLHQICNRSSKPTPQQRRRLYEENIVIKNGKFVKEEDEQIKANWKTFIETYNVEDVPEIFFSLDKQHISVKEKKNFLFFLSKNLPDRTPCSVFQRFKLLMMQAKKGRFTTEEDKYIIEQMEETGCRRSYVAEIAQNLQRPFHSVEKRIHVLKNRHTRTIRWRHRNLAAFIKYLLKVTQTSPDEIEKLKNRHISSQEWMRLSKKLDDVPTRILIRTWMEKIHPLLFVPDNVYDLREVKLKLINMLYENRENDWRSVNWNNYASHFQGLTYLRVYSMMKSLVMSKVPSENRNNLKKCIKILKKCTIEDLAPHTIYKIKYEDGKIIELSNREKVMKRKSK